MKLTSRRDMLRQSGLLAGALGLGPPLAEAATRKLKVVFAGGHPDDPQSGCGGTMARFADLSHEVVALFLTRGELGVPGKSPQETAAIRSAEAQKSCEILRARPVFVNQTDGNTEVNKARYKEFREILDAE